jgi:fumarate reductase iron-sulfur subunit
MSKFDLQVKVLRFIPDTHSEPEYAEYTVPVEASQSVLSVLHYIKDNLDSSLSYRWSCEMAICGSCGAMVNGEPKLLCSTFVKEYGDKPLIIEPLSHFPIIRDLVVDINDFVDKLIKIKPYIVNQDERKDTPGTTEQTPEQLKKFKQFSLCINCLLCYAACPQYGRDDSFVGPAALTLAHRYNRDSRDEGQEQRREVTGTPEGVWECTFAGFCTKVCPKNVAPGSAIQQMKLEHTVHNVKELLLPSKEKQS